MNPNGTLHLRARRMGTQEFNRLRKKRERKKKWDTIIADAAREYIASFTDGTLPPESIPKLLALKDAVLKEGECSEQT